MSEVETLYARILSLVAPRELHSSCNGVLQYEISQLESSVKDLLAAYAKVEEVRDAVSKLEEGKAPSGRSASLMETMDCSLELQEELSKKLEKVATGMIVEAGAEERYIQATAVKRQKPKLKRKRTKEASSSSSSDTSSSSSEASSSSSEEEELNDAGTSALVETKKQKVLETPECRMDSQDLLQGVAKCLKAISTVKVRTKAFYPAESKVVWERALHDLEHFLACQHGVDTDKVVVEMTSEALEAAAGVYESLLVNSRELPSMGASIKSLGAALSQACIDNEMLRTQCARVQLKLTTIATEIFKALVAPLSLKIKNFHAVAQSLSNHSDSQRILHSIRALQSVMIFDIWCKYQSEVAMMANRVNHWICDLPLESYLRDIYHSFAESIRSYSKHFKEAKVQEDWGRMASEIMELMVTKQRRVSPQSRVSEGTNPASKNKKAKLSGLMSRIAQWQNRRVLPKKFDKAMVAFREIWDYKALDWNPHTDSKVLDCLVKLERSITRIKEEPARLKRWKKIEKWRKQLPTAG